MLVYFLLLMSTVSFSFYIFKNVYILIVDPVSIYKVGLFCIHNIYCMSVSLSCKKDVVFVVFPEVLPFCPHWRVLCFFFLFQGLRLQGDLCCHWKCVFCDTGSNTRPNKCSGDYCWCNIFQRVCWGVLFFFFDRFLLCKVKKDKQVQSFNSGCFHTVLCQTFVS